MLTVQGANQAILDQIPKDPRSFVKRLALDPTTSTYIQCPSCYALYSHTGVISCSPPDNRYCDYKATPSSPLCNTPLFDERRLGGKTVYSPRRKYVHQNLKDWVGRLLARSGVEDLLKEPCTTPESPVMQDIWDSPVLRNFRDVDQASFFHGRGEELRLAFSINADGFNPLHMLEAKQTLTCTAVYLVVLNFPPHLRYLFRNMYLAGVIPGPGKPSLDQINHVLSIIITELLEFWKGIHYTATASSASGCFVKGVLIPLVCDMLAARQLAGFSSATSTYFCTFCLITIHDIEDLDKAHWPVRDVSKHLHYAKLWKNSASKAERDATFKAHAIRWSALLDLPYWNPILFSVVDTMHSAYLGMIQSHCRRIWGINASAEGGDGSVLQSTKLVPRPADNILSHWLNVIRTAQNPDVLRDTLSSASRNVLWHICADNGLRRAGGRKVIARRIAEWVSKLPRMGFTANRKPQKSGVDPSQISLQPAGSTSNEISPPPPDDESSLSDTGDEIDALFAEKLERAERAFTTYGTKKHTRSTLPILRQMCRARELDETGTKAELFERLSEWVRMVVLDYFAVVDFMLQRELNIIPPSEEQDSDQVPGAVLGKNILESIWDDMKLTQLPSWMSPAPRNWGTAGRGKLKADQWKVIAAVHLPITLMRLWGKRTDRYFHLLCNFMDLNAAVQLANQRVTTTKHIRDYELLLSRYLQGMMSLFKDTALQPIHHVSLHTVDFLRFFGPTHSVRTYGFERFNGILGSQNVNMKSGMLPSELLTCGPEVLIPTTGELELTFTMTACRTANVEALMDNKDISAIAPELSDAFTTVSDEDHRGTRLADEIHFPPTKPPTRIRLDPRTFELLIQLITDTIEMPGSLNLMSPQLLELGKITISGVIYSNHKLLPRDSNIIFRRPGRISHCIGRVDLIFQPITGETPHPTFLAVSQFSLAQGNPMSGVYRRFGFAGGYLYTERRITPRVIRTSDVLCHFARTPLESEGSGLLHALPLNTVRLPMLACLRPA